MSNIIMTTEEQRRQRINKLRNRVRARVANWDDYAELGRLEREQVDSDFDSGILARTRYIDLGIL